MLKYARQFQSSPQFPLCDDVLYKKVNFYAEITKSYIL